MTAVKTGFSGSSDSNIRFGRGTIDRASPRIASGSSLKTATFLAATSIEPVSSHGARSLAPTMNLAETDIENDKEIEIENKPRSIFTVTLTSTVALATIG